MPDVLLKATNLCKTFGRLAVLNGIDLTVCPGEVVGIAGPNGSGKSTLLNLLTGLVRPDWGRLFFAGRDITRAAAEARVRLGIARTFQVSRPFWGLTVWTQALLSACGAACRKKPVFERRAEELLRRLDLWEYRDLRPEQLSAGMLRRLEVVRALAANPRLLLLDEPFGALSPREEPLLLQVIRDQARSGTAVLLVSHKKRLARLVAGRVYLFEPRQKAREVTLDEWQAQIR